MSYPYKLSVVVKEFGETVSLEGAFEQEEWQMLQDFVSCVDELVATSVVKDGMKASLRLEGDTTNVVRVSTELPQWEGVQAFLHVFRPILLQNESTNFYKICNVLSKKLDHAYFRGMIALQREMYTGKSAREQVQILSNGVPLNSEEVLHQWLNSYEFHRDRDKRKFIDSLHHLLPLDASKAIFLSLLINKAKAAINLGLIARVILGKQCQVTGTMHRAKP